MYRNNQEESKKFMNSYSGIPGSLYSKNLSPVTKKNRYKNANYNQKEAVDGYPAPATYIAQKITESEEITVS